MSEDRYEPISCDYHDQLEAAAMHRNEVELEFDLDGTPHHEKGRVKDVYTSNGAEFITFASDTGEVRIRLDHIISMKEEV